MRLFPPSFLSLPALAVLMLATSAGHAQGLRGRPIEYAEPSNQEENSMLSPKQSRLGALESEINRPFDSFTPGRSLDGVMLTPPLPAPAPVTRNSRNSSNKRLDWMYRSAEDLLSVDPTDEKYQRPELTPDGRDRSKLRPMERAYYDALDSRGVNPMTNQSAFQTDGTLIPGFPNLTPGSIPGQPTLPGTLNNSLQQSLQNTRAFSAPGASDATDFSSYNRNQSFPGKPTDAELRRAQQFMEIYNFSGQPGSTELPGASSIRSSPYVNSSFYELSKPPASTPAPSISGGFGSAQAGAGPITPGTPILPGNAYTPPAPQPVRSTLPSSPFMNVNRGGIQ